MNLDGKTGRKSIFRSIFVPMIIVMVLQAIIFYTAAMYGGLQESLGENAVDILSERMNNRRNEIETVFNNRWSNLDDCVAAINNEYARYEKEYGDKPLVGDPKAQVAFLGESGEPLIDALRFSRTNGIFLIINDSEDGTVTPGEQRYGLCIRDMDQESNYSGTEDLLLERSPAAVVNSLGCLLDSWWEAKYTFESKEKGDFYYAPLAAAYQKLSRNSYDLAYFSDIHQLSGSDPKVVSYSIPLMSGDGFPYAVLGIELSEKYLSSLLPSRELYENDKGCYILAQQKEGEITYDPVVGVGALYNRCFGDTGTITRGKDESTGGFTVVGRDGTNLYTTAAKLEVYNNNSPFETRSLVLLAMVESDSLFSYIGHIKTVLMIVSLLSLIFGVLAMTVVNRRFAAPIMALARRVRGRSEQNANYRLGRVGVTEIDQLVESIEELNRNVSRGSARSEFFSRMSHDMRTPMNAIISFSSPEMLENADEKVKDDYLDKIHGSGIYLLGLINEVLDMTKIENNKTELRVTLAQAKEIFETPINMISRLAAEKKIKFVTHLNIPDDLYVMADEQHLSQIVMNLLSNAVKFTKEGGTVTLSIDISGDAEKTFNIVVSDTGIGMSEEFMKNLYTPFEQANVGHEGTGLGLSIAKKLVEMMNGHIGCESKLGSGTVFTVTLPLTPASDAAVAEKKKEDAPQNDLTALSGKKVLVCEDNEINAKIVVLLLERVGISADVAENGERGVEVFGASAPYTYGAILMDIRMPVMNGLDATKAIRKLPRDDAAGVPIIAMTADAFTEDEESCLSAGMNAHLAKPIEPQKLYGTLLKYVK